MHMDENTQGVNRTFYRHYQDTSHDMIWDPSPKYERQSPVIPASISSCPTPVDRNKLREGQGIWGKASQI